MLRRIALTLAIVLVPTTVVVACGGSGSDSTSDSSLPESSGDVDFTASSFTLVADRVEGTTVLTNDDKSVSVEIPDSALPQGLDATEITASVERVIATEAGTVIDFVLGPDGTEFVEPVTLTWTGDWDPEGVVAVSAVADDGTNLISSPDDSEEILKTLQVAPNEDGTSTVSVEVNHFSQWSFLNFGGNSIAVSATGSFDSEFLLAWSIAQFPTVFFGVDIGWRLGENLGFETSELCLEVRNVELSGVVAINQPDFSKTGLRKCTVLSETESEPLYFVEEKVDLQCTSPNRGSLSASLVAYFGAPGLSPLEMFVILLGGELKKNLNAPPASNAWLISSTALLYVHRSIENRFDCQNYSTTTMNTSTSIPGTSSPAPSDSTDRPTSSGATSAPKSTSTTVVVTTTTEKTTTTVRATTTTKPRQGATTTLPRPSGGTTTLP